MKIVLDIVAWIITIASQLVIGFIAGYIFFAEGYGDIFFMWVGITINVFLIGLVGTFFRKTFNPKKYLMRLGLTALGVSFSLLYFYQFNFYYNADYEMFPEYPFLAAVGGILGFYIFSWLVRESFYWKIIRVVGYVISVLIVCTGLYVLWNWFTPSTLPIKNLEANQSLNIELINIVGDGFNIEVMRENYIYGISDKRLAVFDISNPEHIFPVGQSQIINGDLFRINLFGDYAYITAGGFGNDTGNKIHIVDVSDLTHPRYLASYDLSGKYIWDVKIFDEYLYIIGCIECTEYSWDQHALYILDLTNPEKPEEIGHFYSKVNISDVTVYKGYAYIALAEDEFDHSGLSILDISNPKEPKEINSLFPSGQGYITTISGGKLYYYGGASQESINGLYILDISSPRNPTEISFHPNSGYDDINILPDSLGYTTKSIPCLCDATATGETPKTTLTLIDYSNPYEPKQRGTLEFEGFSVDVYERMIFAWDSVAQAYRFFDISNAAVPKEAGVYIPFSLHDLSGEIFVDGIKGVMPTEETDLYILDLSNPSLPILSNIYDVGDYYTVVEIFENHVYLYLDTEIQVLDISNPLNPVVVWHYNAVGGSGNYIGMSVEENYAFLIDESDGLNVYNVSNPANPVLVSHQESLKGFNYIDGFDATGKNFYIFKDRVFHAFDLSDPQKISEIDKLETSTYQRVTIIGNLAFLDDSPYIGNKPAILSIVDLSNPSKLKLVSSYHWLQYSKV